MEPAESGGDRIEQAETAKGPQRRPEEPINTANCDKSIDTNLTVSTKLSTDQLIFKSPRESPDRGGSIGAVGEKGPKCDDAGDSFLLHLGALQLLFGFFMAVFGVLVITHDASLSQVGGGIWGGCLAMATGICGLLAAARAWCPLKSTPQKVAHTAFLALSLTSLAIAQLVVALASTGLGRDINNSDYFVEEESSSFNTTTTTTTSTTTPASGGKISIVLPPNYLSILCNIGLLVVSAVECVLAAVASYKSSRSLCPCFRGGGPEDAAYTSHHRNSLVSSWLGKHTPPPLYIVAAPSSLGASSKLSGGFQPVFAMPPRMMPPPMVRYPLIPAPLGTIPSPIIPPPSRKEMIRRHNKRQKARYPPGSRRSPGGPRCRTRSRSASKERSVTQEDVVRTYTGLDKAIAEEFIDICDSRHPSLCSDSSCTSSCRRSCKGDCTCSSDASRDYLVNKM